MTTSVEMNVERARRDGVFEQARRGGGEVVSAALPAENGGERSRQYGTRSTCASPDGGGRGVPMNVGAARLTQARRDAPGNGCRNARGICADHPAGRAASAVGTSQEQSMLFATQLIVMAEDETTHAEQRARDRRAPHGARSHSGWGLPELPACRQHVPRGHVHFGSCG